MLPTTYDAVKAVLKADQSIIVAERNQMLAALRNGGSVKPKAQPPPDIAPRLLRRAEVARRLSISLRTVDKLPLRKFKLPGRVRAAGFLEADVVELLTGGELA
jgi:hypothetical protein